MHNSLQNTIEDIGTLVNGNETYIIGNPGRGMATLTPTQGLTTPFPTPKPIRTYDAFELTVSRRFSNRWFASANYTLSRLYGNYAGPVELRRDSYADHGHLVSRGAAEHG